MTRYSIAAVAALLLLPFLSVAGPEAPREVTGRLEVVQGLRVLRLWGEPESRGFAQGWLLAGSIVEGADTGFRMVRGRIGGRYEGQLRPLAAKGFSFSAAEEAELAGLLAGLRARLPEDERRIESLGREMDLTDLKALNTFGDWYSLGCSSAAVWGGATPDGTPAVVRNFDFVAMDLVLEGQHLRVVAPHGEEKGWVGMAHPGSAGAMTAMGSDGVFAAIHDVNVKPALPDYMQGNVPRLLAIKRIVAEVPAEGAVEAAAARCREWNTLYGNNFLVATPEPGEGLPAGVVEYDTRETEERGVALRGPGEGRAFVVCSNHHRLRADGRCGRYDRLAAGCGAEREGAFDVPALFDLGSLAAVPGPEAAVAERAFGTLHQVVALTGTRKIFVRVAGAQSNIRDVEPVEFDVAALLADAEGEDD
jgi:hypothetical protein